MVNLYDCRQLLLALMSSMGERSHIYQPERENEISDLSEQEQGRVHGLFLAQFQHHLIDGQQFARQQC